MCDTEKNPALPENADKVLFAEDFVNHILLEHELPLLSSGIADHRALIYNAFTPQVKLALNYVFECLEADIDLKYIKISKQNKKGIETENFKDYADTLKLKTLEKMLPIESRAESLITFCFEISTMAAKFYKDECNEAPDLAVIAITDIISDIDMVQEGGWKAFHALAEVYAQNAIDLDDNNMTPSGSDRSSSDRSSSDRSSSDRSSSDRSSSDRSSSESWTKENSDASLSPDNDGGDDHDENDSSSRGDSDASHSPHREMDGGDDQDENDSSSRLNSPDHEMDGADDNEENGEKLTDDYFCKTCIAAMSTSSEGPDSSSSKCKHVEKTIDVKSENIVSFPDNTLNFVSSGSSGETNSDASLNSLEETSGEDDTSKQKRRKLQKKKSSHSHSKNSDSDSDKGEKDRETTTTSIYLAKK